MLDGIIKYLKIFILLGILLFEGYYLGNFFLDEEAKKVESNHYVLNINEAITVKMGQKILSKIETLKKENRLKSLLVVLDTPGGSPVASDNLYSYFKSLKKEIPVYIYINSAAASGGYYIAVSGDIIYANKNALVGSIGVIMQNISFAKLAQEYGIKDETISLGEYKHFMSPLKDMDSKTKEYLKENLLEPIYKNFADTVASEREISNEDRKKYFEGKVFIAGDKKIQGVLVDKIISYPDMVNQIKQEQNTNIIKKLEYKEKASDMLGKLFTSIELLTNSQNRTISIY